MTVVTDVNHQIDFEKLPQNEAEGDPVVIPSVEAKSVDDEGEVVSDDKKRKTSFWSYNGLKLFTLLVLYHSHIGLTISFTGGFVFAGPPPLFDKFPFADGIYPCLGKYPENASTKPDSKVHVRGYTQTNYCNEFLCVSNSTYNTMEPLSRVWGGVTYRQTRSILIKDKDYYQFSGNYLPDIPVFWQDYYQSYLSDGDFDKTNHIWRKPDGYYAVSSAICSSVFSNDSLGMWDVYNESAIYYFPPNHLSVIYPKEDKFLFVASSAHWSHTANGVFYLVAFAIFLLTIGKELIKLVRFFSILKLFKRVPTNNTSPFQEILSDEEDLHKLSWCARNVSCLVLLTWYRSAFFQLLYETHHGGDGWGYLRSHAYDLIFTDFPLVLFTSLLLSMGNSLLTYANIASSGTFVFIGFAQLAYYYCCIKNRKPAANKAAILPTVNKSDEKKGQLSLSQEIAI